MYPDSNENGNNISNSVKKTLSEFKSAHPLVLLSFLFIFICLLLIFINAFFPQSDDDDNTVNVIEKEDVVSRLNSMKLDPKVEDTEFLTGNEIETYFEYYIEFGALFPPGVQLYKIGDEVVTTDFYNYFILKEKPESINNPSLIDEDFISAMDEVIRSESVILQTFAEEDPTLQKSILNDGIITYLHLKERDQAYKEAVDKYIMDNIWVMKGERITIWYHNMFIPKIGEDAAKDLAYSKISSIHDRVSSGEISMKEAGELIKADEEIGKIDIAWESNAYAYFESPQGYGVFLDPQLDEKLKEMEEGELSEILTGNDVDGGYDAFYTFVKIREIQGDKRHIIEVYDENYMNYPIEYL